MSKSELRNKVMAFAEECKSDPTRYSQAAASVLFALAGALSANAEEALMSRVVGFVQGDLQRIHASRN